MPVQEARSNSGKYCNVSGVCTADGGDCSTDRCHPVFILPGYSHKRQVSLPTTPSCHSFTGLWLAGVKCDAVCLACWPCAHSPYWLIFPLLTVCCCKRVLRFPHMWPSGERKGKIIEIELQKQCRLSELYGEPSFRTATVSGSVRALTQRHTQVSVSLYLRYGVPLMKNWQFISDLAPCPKKHAYRCVMVAMSWPPHQDR